MCSTEHTEFYFYIWKVPSGFVAKALIALKKGILLPLFPFVGYFNHVYSLVNIYSYHDL